MLKKLLLLQISFFIINSVNCQVIVVPIGVIGAAIMPEHGFLPGKKFKFYPTIAKYDLNGRKFRVELFDDRANLKLEKLQCSDIEFTNTSEFSNSNCIYKVSKYIDTLFTQSHGFVDSTATDTLKVWFEGIDARLFGFGYIRVHGLCQMKVSYHNFTETYCTDITDADKNSPISPSAFVTRQTATRIMASAAIREIIEQIIVDLRSFE